jgi:3-hydroxyacyl-CoA dehydrogenase
MFDYIDSHLDEYSSLSKVDGIYGKYATFPDMDTAVKDAWLVIETVPENLELEVDIFGKLDQKAPKDCILASNSSSSKSRSMLDNVSQSAGNRYSI